MNLECNMFLQPHGATMPLTHCSHCKDSKLFPIQSFTCCCNSWHGPQALLQLAYEMLPQLFLFVQKQKKVTACFNITLALKEQLAPTNAGRAGGGRGLWFCSVHAATVLLIKGMCFVGRVCGSACKSVVEQQNQRVY